MDLRTLDGVATLTDQPAAAALAALLAPTPVTANHAEAALAEAAAEAKVAASLAALKFLPHEAVEAPTLVGTGAG